MPDDYLGRLLARHAPAGGDGLAGTGEERPVLVRPRLPGPFERIEALRGAPAEPDDPAALYPQAPRTTPFEGERVRYEREIRTTERETVLRAEAPRRADADPDGQQLPSPDAVLLPPVSPVPALRPATAPDAARPQRRAAARTDDGGAVRPTASAPSLRGTAAAPAAAVPALRPWTAEAPTARSAARAAAAGRRGGRPAERVVHVQIGRLEVTAAGAQDRTAAARPERTSRREASLSLADYLARAERRN